jgi:hypothetical protein
MCGLLLASLYGARDAASNWETELSGFLTGYGLVKGRARTGLFSGSNGEITAAVHGDDITVEGRRSEVEQFVKAVEKKYEIKAQVLGRSPDLLKEGKILNRAVSWSDLGIWWEADESHGREVVRKLGPERANLISTP